MFRRGAVFYCEDRTTGQQKSLLTRDEDQAQRILQAKNDAVNQPLMNLVMAKTYPHAPKGTRRVLLSLAGALFALCSSAFCQSVAVIGNNDGKLNEYSEATSDVFTQTLLSGYSGNHTIYWGAIWGGSGPVPTFLTMTYPAKWDNDPRVWKKHLDRFWRAALRAFPALAAMWKLEPQPHRMAPHFHALCWGVSRIPWQWLAVRWACIIHGVARGPKKFPMGPGKAGAAEFREWLDHVSTLPEEVKESIRVGTKIEKLRSWNGVAYYVAKYISKGVEGGWENVGRYWGIVGRAKMPWSPVGEEFINYRTAVLIRRTARRYLRSKGIRIPHQRRRVMIITDNLEVWLRMCEACCGAAVQRMKAAGPAA